MDAITEFFPEFAEYNISINDVPLYALKGGQGPPLLLLHGFPQNHMMWRTVATALAERFTTIALDLRGYGRSSVPSSREGAGYSKRVMATEIVALMRRLGHPRFRVAGHDLGGRVAYRLALDHPECVEKIATLDILPASETWRAMDADLALRAYHSTFLAQPEPLPEKLLTRAWFDYLDHTLASWTARRSLAPFNGAALASYRAAFADPDRIHAMCEDYRAGATIDRADDDADAAAGKTIEAPLLALWGYHGLYASSNESLDVWRRWAHDVRGHGVDCGHFLPEEAPEATLDALLEFFS